MRKRQTMVFSETPENLIYIVKRNGGDTLILNSFKLGGERLAKLMDKIAAELPNLKVLGLNGIDLDSLPETIGRLRNLEHLDVSNNNLTSLPRTFKKLAKLKGLRLINNKFENHLDSELIPDKLADSGKISLEGNPLSLKNFLSMIKDSKLRRRYDVDEYAVRTAVQLESASAAKSLAINLASIYPGLTVKEFYKFLKPLSEKQIQQVNPSKLSYRSPDSDGKSVLSLQSSEESKEMTVLKELQNLAKRPQLKTQRSLSDSKLSKKSDDSPLIKKPALFSDEQQKREQNERRKIFPEMPSIPKQKINAEGKFKLPLRRSKKVIENLAALSNVQNLSRKKKPKSKNQRFFNGKENSVMSALFSPRKVNVR